MENIVEEVLHWLMKTAEVLASSGYLAAKQYVVTSALVWIITSLLFSTSMIIIGRHVQKIEVKDDYWEGFPYFCGVILYLVASVSVFVVIPPNVEKLLAPDWHTINLLIHTITGK